MFFGRDKELATLKDFYEEKELDGTIIYGRRRLGKTSLIKQSRSFFPGDSIYYQCLKSPDLMNARGLATVVRSVFPNAVISENSSFTEVLALVFSLSIKHPLLLVLDEYPYLENQPTIDSFIQSEMEQYKGKSQMKIILSGSYIDVMEHILDADCPLHGRFRYKINLQPFDYFDSANFYKEACLTDKVRYYSVFGGTPYYLNMINPDLSFEDNVKSLILSEFAPLANEITTTLSEEYSKISCASYLMNLIVSGKHSYSDINSAFKKAFPKSDLPYLLNLLLEMRFISKQYAINDHKESRAYYYLLDNLFSFYYQLVYPTLAEKGILSLDDYFRLCIEERMNRDFIPHKFEEICREFLLRENKNGRIDPPLLALGPYTYNDPKTRTNGQFDIVARDEKGNSVFECKFTKEKIGASIEKEEIGQLKKAKIPFYRLGYFSRAGYDGLESDSTRICYTLEDLYR